MLVQAVASASTQVRHNFSFLNVKQTFTHFIFTRLIYMDILSIWKDLKHQASKIKYNKTVFAHFFLNLNFTVSNQFDKLDQYD